MARTIKNSYWDEHSIHYPPNERLLKPLAWDNAALIRTKKTNAFYLPLYF